jgi:hypothetical protein
MIEQMEGQIGLPRGDRLVRDERRRSANGGRLPDEKITLTR